MMAFRENMANLSDGDKKMLNRHLLLSECMDDADKDMYALLDMLKDDTDIYDFYRTFVSEEEPVMIGTFVLPIVMYGSFAAIYFLSKWYNKN